MKQFFSQFKPLSQRGAVGLGMAKHRPCFLETTWQGARFIDTNTIRQKPR
jgi:hypothetical protein